MIALVGPAAAYDKAACAHIAAEPEILWVDQAMPIRGRKQSRKLRTIAIRLLRVGALISSCWISEGLLT